jgi:2-polyprenyl-3-methyl-5-hydroxy-6-metoxy-1,4-benzoquinol methylase
MKNPMYNEFAKEYEKAISDNIYNANLERPSLISMLPKLKGKSVLDLGCGPGFYSEHLVNAGAKVTAIDASSKMVDIVRKKLGSKIHCYVQDLSCGLPTEKNDSYYYNQGYIVITPMTINENDYSLLEKMNNEKKLIPKFNPNANNKN